LPFVLMNRKRLLDRKTDPKFCAINRILWTKIMISECSRVWHAYADIRVNSRTRRVRRDIPLYPTKLHVSD